MKCYKENPGNAVVYEIRTGGWSTFVPGIAAPGSEITDSLIRYLNKWIPKEVKKHPGNERLISVKAYRFELERDLRDFEWQESNKEEANAQGDERVEG